MQEPEFGGQEWGRVIWGYEDFQSLAVYLLNSYGIRGTAGLTN